MGREKNVVLKTGRKGERGADFRGGGKLVGGPGKVTGVEGEQDDTIAAGFGFRLRTFGFATFAAGLLDGGEVTTFPVVEDEVLLAEAKSERDVLHRNDGDEDDGESGSCEFARHCRGTIGQFWRKSIESPPFMSGHGIEISLASQAG